MSQLPTYWSEAVICWNVDGRRIRRVPAVHVLVRGSHLPERGRSSHPTCPSSRLIGPRQSSAGTWTVVAPGVSQLPTLLFEAVICCNVCGRRTGRVRAVNILVRGSHLLERGRPSHPTCPSCRRIVPRQSSAGTWTVVASDMSQLPAYWSEAVTCRNVDGRRTRRVPAVGVLVRGSHLPERGRSSDPRGVSQLPTYWFEVVICRNVDRRRR